VVTDTARPAPARYRQDRLQYTAPQIASTQCNKILNNLPTQSKVWSASLSVDGTSIEVQQALSGWEMRTGFPDCPSLTV